MQLYMFAMSLEDTYRGSSVPNRQVLVQLNTPQPPSPFSTPRHQKKNTPQPGTSPHIQTWPRIGRKIIRRHDRTDFWIPTEDLANPSNRKGAYALVDSRTIISAAFCVMAVGNRYS